ncbi:Uncharacterised protein [Pluralibacter gergoviae]|nr:Uncharacterised protein [Pluralibacter gergoviae]
MQARDLNAHLHPQRGVEVGERLIEQEDARLGHQRAADSDALALTAGERFRLAVQQVRQLQHFRHLIHPLLDKIFFRPGQLEAKRHIFRHRQVRIEGVGLKHHADAALGGRRVVHPLTAYQQLAAGYRLQPGDHPQQRRFTAARWPDKHHEFAVADIEIDIFRYHDVAPGFCHVSQLYARHALLPKKHQDGPDYALSVTGVNPPPAGFLMGEETGG